MMVVHADTSLLGIASSFSPFSSRPVLLGSSQGYTNTDPLQSPSTIRLMQKLVFGDPVSTKCQTLTINAEPT